MTLYSRKASISHAYHFPKCERVKLVAYLWIPIYREIAASRRTADMKNLEERMKNLFGEAELPIRLHNIFQSQP